MTSEVGQIRQTLVARLKELNAQIARIEEEQRQPLDDDFAEQAGVRAQDEALDGVEQSVLAQIGQTREALDRLDAGTYGLCVACGEPIAPTRLSALPAAAQCISCAERSSGRVGP